MFLGADELIQDATSAKSAQWPYAADEVTAYLGSTLVNNPKIDVAECVDPTG